MLLARDQINQDENESHAECWFLYIWFVTLQLLRTNWCIMAPVMFVLRVVLQIVCHYWLLRQNDSTELQKN